MTTYLRHVFYILIVLGSLIVSASSFAYVQCYWDPDVGQVCQTYNNDDEPYVQTGIYDEDSDQGWNQGWGNHGWEHHHEGGFHEQHWRNYNY